jgi:predicted MFS family arabinose efflux permease
VLLVFGLSALLGIWLVGLLIDRWLRPLVLISCSLFGLLALSLVFWIDSPTVIYSAVAVWGLAFGGLPALLQTALAKSAGESADAALDAGDRVEPGHCGRRFGGRFAITELGRRGFPWAVALLMLLAGAGQTPMKKPPVFSGRGLFLSKRHQYFLMSALASSCLRYAAKSC